MRVVARRAAIAAALALSLLPFAMHRLESAPAGTAFATQIEQLSEPEGVFDTDNLISNEGSYLHVIPALLAAGVSGGVYIGVGPDQNFSYIARVRPTTAYIIDIRRDNLLLHLLFKALFARSSTRVEYLSHLTGRAPPHDLDRWRRASIEDIAAQVDGPALSANAISDLRRQVDRVVAGFGVKLSATDLRTIDRFHHAFIEDGLALQFHTFGRGPAQYYPTFRDLLVASDASGHAWNYLASEEDFQFVKSLEARDAIIPVVGNVAGPHAMQAIADAITARGTRVSAFYVSNIESYLYRDGSFSRFVENVGRLPRDEHTVMIRSIFGGAGSSTSMIDTMEALLATPRRGRIR